MKRQTLDGVITGEEGEEGEEPEPAAYEYFDGVTRAASLFVATMQEAALLHDEGKTVPLQEAISTALGDALSMEYEDYLALRHVLRIAIRAVDDTGEFRRMREVRTQGRP